MAIRLDGHHFGELYDFWGGYEDLENGIIRVLHSLSFVDDPTRILRAIRFEKRFDFKIENRTLDLLKQAREHLNDVSGERLRHELDLILAEPNAPDMLDRLYELNLLQSLFENIHWNREKIRTLDSFLKQSLPQDWFGKEMVIEPLRISIAYNLLGIDAEQVSLLRFIKRLKIKNQLARMMIQANTLWRLIDSFTYQKPSQISEVLDSYSIPVIYSVYFNSHDQKLKKIINKYISSWRNIKPFTNGNELIKFGIKQGPDYSRILATLKNAWVDGTITNKVEELKLLDNLLIKIQK
jgi:tRNA nucleotidyltransferase (CCA-adding enzyme)